MTLWTLERLLLPGLAIPRDRKGLSTPESTPFVGKLTTPEPAFPHLNGLPFPYSKQLRARNQKAGTCLSFQ